MGKSRNSSSFLKGKEGGGGGEQMTNLTFFFAWLVGLELRRRLHWTLGGRGGGGEASFCYYYYSGIFFSTRPSAFFSQKDFLECCRITSPSPRHTHIE